MDALLNLASLLVNGTPGVCRDLDRAESLHAKCIEGKADVQIIDDCQS